MTLRIWALILTLAVPGWAWASVEAGKALYGAKGCAGCHAIDGQGGAIGPNLSKAGLVAGHDRDWQVRHLLNPAAVTPGSIMPKLVTNPEDAGNLADYILSLRGAEAPAAAAPAPAEASQPEAPPPPGNAIDGQSVFARKGCAACHTIRGSGGTLGPDLTFEGEVKAHDATWHRKHLADPRSVSPGSTMPPFVLTPEEQSDLVAYLTSLRHLAQDRRLSPELATRFVALDASLMVLKERVAHASRRGRNVDDLNASLTDAWTQVGTVEDMIRKQDVTKAGSFIAHAEAIALDLTAALDAFDGQLHTRRVQTVATILMLVLGSALVTWKVRLLSADWEEQERTRRPRRKRPEGEDDAG